MSLCVKTPLFLLPWQTEYYWSVNSADFRLQACICCFSERLCHSGPLPVKTQATTKPSLAACSHSSPSLPLSTMTPPLLLQALRLNTAVLNKQCLWHLRGVIVTWSGCQSAAQTQRARWSENLLRLQREGVCVSGAFGYKYILLCGVELDPLLAQTGGSGVCGQQTQTTLFLHSRLVLLLS